MSRLRLKHNVLRLEEMPIWYPHLVHDLGLTAAANDSYWREFGPRSYDCFYRAPGRTCDETLRTDEPYDGPLALPPACDARSASQLRHLTGACAKLAAYYNSSRVVADATALLRGDLEAFGALAAELAALVDSTAESSARRAAALQIGAKRAQATAADVARLVEEFANPHDCSVGGGEISVRRAALLAFTELARGDDGGVLLDSVKSCVPALSEQLVQPDEDASEMAVRAMSALGAHADIVSLDCALEDNRENVRSAAADALVCLRDTLTESDLKTIGHRLTIFDDDNEDEDELKSERLRVLAGIGAAAASQASVVAACLGDEAVAVRAAAAKALGAMGNGAAAAHVAAIAALLEDDESSARAAAVESLGLLGATSHTEAISELLGDADRGVRRAAAATLKRWESNEGGVEEPTSATTLEPTVVLVRCHNPTPGALRRMGAWASSLKEVAMQPLHVSVDKTHGVEVGARVREAVGLEPSCVHAYDDAELQRSFPHLAEVAQKMVGEPGWSGFERAAIAGGVSPRSVAGVCTPQATWRRWSGPHGSIAWGFHAEAIALWWRRCASDGWASCGGVRPSYVWILEDDVGYTAPLAHLVQSYASCDADLITNSPVPSEPVHDVRVMNRAAELGTDQVATNPIRWEGWCWHDTCTASYAALAPSADRVRTKEHAQRFSSRLLDEVASQVEGGCSAWSEQFFPTLCGALDGYTCAPLQASSLPPDPDTQYNCTGRVTEEEYDRMCSESQTVGVLLHALKW